MRRTQSESCKNKMLHSEHLRYSYVVKPIPRTPAGEDAEVTFARFPLAEDGITKIKHKNKSMTHRLGEDFVSKHIVLADSSPGVYMAGEASWVRKPKDKGGKTPGNGIGSKNCNNGDKNCWARVAATIVAAVAARVAAKIGKGGGGASSAKVTRAEGENKDENEDGEVEDENEDELVLCLTNRSGTFKPHRSGLLVLRDVLRQVLGADAKIQLRARAVKCDRAGRGRGLKLDRSSD